MLGKKTGGRQKGTPNKATSRIREAISSVLDDYYNSAEFLTDLAALKPVERVMAMEKLAAYVAPKLQSTTLDVALETKKTIEDRLTSLNGSDE